MLKKARLIGIGALTVCLLLTLRAQGQHEEGTGMVKLRTGYAQPFGSFGKNSGSLDYNGFVAGGVHYGFEAVYFFSKNAGFGGLLSYNRNKIDDRRLSSAYINSNINYDTAFVNVDPFSSIIGMVGIYFDFPVADFMAFTFKMMAGSLMVKKPEGVVRIQNQVTTNLQIIESSNFSSKFAIYNGVGLRFNPINNWNITFDVEYIGSKLDFSYTRNNDVIKRTNHIQILTFTLGIAYFIE
ncbi:MAG: outer membrane beta-barrel protein [Bacteroidales bacterium]|nr:outer membrane beta-barrel protein [Bacteroidales bacterium]